MKRIALILCVAALVFGMPQQAAGQGRPQRDTRARVLVDNDFCGDPDGLFALAQQVLCNNANLRGIVGAHLGGGGMVRGDQAAASVQKAQDLLDVMDLSGRWPLVKGASGPMVSPEEAQDSPGARLWQVPRDAYRQCLYSFASVDRRIRPLGAAGAFLGENLDGWRCTPKNLPNNWDTEKCATNRSFGIHCKLAINSEHLI